MTLYRIRATSAFKKDLKLAKKRGKDLDKLFSLVDLLASGQELPAKFRDHSLTGNFRGTRECHVEPDWLLVYEKREDLLVLSLLRNGTHSDLFGK